jgi:hypothetical protein
MNRSHLGPALLIVLSMIVSFGCSGNQSAANSNAADAGNAAANQSVIANTNGVPANANNVEAENGKYPESVAEEFMKSCEESGGTKEFCTCMFDKVQQEYTFEDFSTIETKISAGEPPDEFVEFTGKARAACTK